MSEVYCILTAAVLQQYCFVITGTQIISCQAVFLYIEWQNATSILLFSLLNVCIYFKAGAILIQKT